jgi:hypothetical protein
VSSPAIIEDDRDVNPGFIHAGDELLGGSYFGVGLGVEDSETGVTLNILAAVFLYLRREHMGVKVDNHRQIITGYPDRLQAS